ncbi:MAG: hypothetical protein HY961_06020 [Ignavibacteriae bacterium]|nr:hypothetical protein [Ignavibacteriota bacterium]
MKKLAVLLTAALLIAVLGCGPSQEQKQMVADLTTEVTNLVNDTHSSLDKLDDVSGQVSSTLAGADTLARKFPKDTVSITNVVTQLHSAKDRLTSVKENVTAWIGAYKMPDLDKMKFDEVISNLKKSKDDLASATQEINGALSGATSAIENYRKVETELSTKVASKKK